MAYYTVKDLYELFKEEMEKGHGEFIVFAGWEGQIEDFKKAIWFKDASEEEIERKDLVKVTCSDKTQIWDRKKAIEFYEECFWGTEGREHERYGDILDQLEDGEKVCSDEMTVEEEEAFIKALCQSEELDQD